MAGIERRQGGADGKVVQLMLGHASATMTMDTYRHLFENRVDEVAEALDRARAQSEVHGSTPPAGGTDWVRSTGSATQRSCASPGFRAALAAHGYDLDEVGVELAAGGVTWGIRRLACWGGSPISPFPVVPVPSLAAGPTGTTVSRGRDGQ